MACEERLADRVRALLGDLVIRVAATDYEHMLDEPHVRPMDFTGRPMRGWIYVARKVSVPRPHSPAA